jgi:hypothetical protein
VPVTRPAWSRTLFLGRTADLDELVPDPADVRACSRFRCAAAPDRHAVYVVWDRPRAPWVGGAVEHTLATVREFRRVPLDASGLALMVFTARPGRAAQVLATLAHWVERAVSLYQPGYVLLARSVEQPGLSVLITGVDERRALEGSWPSPFSVEPVLGELSPFLAAPPEAYRYGSDGVAAISPGAV